MNIKDIPYLNKTIDCLNNLIVCLKDNERKDFYSINNDIYSLMFDGTFLKSDFTMMLPLKLSGEFANIMWNISRTGSYFGGVISNYKVKDIIGCVERIILEIKNNLK